MRVRFLDLGTVPYLESQTIYHAIAYAMTENNPDTITLMSPDSPYVSVGFLQEVDKEIDLDFCAANGLPVLRREVGGGAVYLDGNQTFVHFIFHRERLPRQVEKVYALFIKPIVETYRALGIDAAHRPVNDIVVGDRKIGGTGMAAIGPAIVMAGSLMFDFDTATMARALKVSSEKMRDKVHESLEQYMTTMRRELGQAPPRQQVVDLFKGRLAELLDVDLEPGELMASEKRAVRTLNRRFQSARWLKAKGGRPPHGVKIKGDILVVEAEHKAPGGLVRVTARLRDDVIEDLTLSGDFAFYPAALVGDLEAALRGHRLDLDEITAVVRDFYASSDVQAPGTSPEDLAEAILKVKGAATL